MLPQSAALEAPVADKRQGKYETDRGNTPVRNSPEGRFQITPDLKRYKALTGSTQGAYANPYAAWLTRTKKGDAGYGYATHGAIPPQAKA